MPPEQPLLTIAIPTYNRARYLKQLLDSLAPQLKGRDEVELIISDNASEDETHSIVDAFRQFCPDLRYLRNRTNGGADRNILQCFAQASGRYVWIIGDDDVLIEGALRTILAAVRLSPAIVHITSRSFKGTFRPEDFPAPAHPKVRMYQDNLAFTKAMNVWATFISGIVVSKELYLQLGAPPLERFLRTNLIQLGWVLPLLGGGSRFLSIATPLVASKAANTGGYNLVKIFGSNFRSALEQTSHLDPRVIGIIENALITRFFPGFALKLRDGRHNFEPGDFQSDLYSLYHHNPRFWLFLWPVCSWNRAAAKLTYAATRIISRLDTFLGSPLL